MTRTVSGGIERLRSEVTGPVHGPADDGYDDARRVWNGAVDRRPAVVVQCASTADVAAAVRYARSEGLEVAVRGGAHSIPGLSSVDGGLVIDLRLLNAVGVDPVARRARVQGGALMGDVDAATQAHGLAVPMGLISHTGVGGLTLGGGMGWLTRQGGLTVDNILSAEVVIADGRVLRAAPEENADLYWAIRGGGGNFGVVTEFEFRLLDVGPIVQFGLFFWEQARGGEALRLMRDIAAELPRSMSAVPAAALTAPAAPFVPVEHHGIPGYGLMLVGFGDPAEHQQVAERIRLRLPPLFDVVTPMPFTAVQQVEDEANPWGVCCYGKGGYFAELTDEVIDVLVDHAPRKTSPMSVLLFYRLDEAYSEIGEDDTAFGGGRSPRWNGFFIGLAPTPDTLPDERSWIRSVEQALRPHMIGSGTYVNALESQDLAQVEASYGAKYGRLASVKAAYDPGNVFHRNANIPGAVAPSPRA
ncbi:FAD-binding oxidoreductase [Geodermatophilus sabuli]|uniref:FAD/FMN-containing dehydrogenase n=1 Tax=Geodermatophilus sabuli TaxID=1564158 RepID=A0A285EH84_9ACTN|nr:FAD-binding oxidoreductase [Geodermatophilus sabuli]MBB3086020.1 FAD/FMN-containing dehydrogenase [Geodermatophilus sabuli]SNX98360.1 FAD/FMN-containing dehydrogenase [Geodermatophilus sabuli]